MPNYLPTQERKPHIQADILGNHSGMGSLIPAKPPPLPFSPDLLAYSHPQVPNTSYLCCLWNPLLSLPELACVLELLPVSWNATLWLHFFFLFCSIPSLSSSFCITVLRPHQPCPAHADDFFYQTNPSPIWSPSFLAASFFPIIINFSKKSCLS